ncbi:unnamed protein product [Phytophthora fragariaefolia]|uniref:Unnamed protein product n=1 Tax=Phytophthora fragariaefolia TaxID=1490495 RepID=A0A9W6YB75_9STRA|nr:unnamed protein product [Phytophthora fragariaefolia]
MNGYHTRGAASPHLQNNTNNRLECKWGKFKQVIKPSFTLDETISTLIALQRYAEDEYVAQYHEAGSQPHMDEDPELATLTMQISSYAFNLVADQYAFAVGPRADYEMDLSTAGQAKLVRPSSGSTHAIDIAVRMRRYEGYVVSDIVPVSMWLRF